MVLVDNIEDILKLLVCEVLAEPCNHVLPLLESHLTALVLVERVENLVERYSLFANHLLNLFEAVGYLLLSFGRNCTEGLSLLPLENRHVVVS